MEFFRNNTNINFMAQRKWAALVSTILFLFSLLSLFVYGLNWGLDFTGGTQIELHFPTPVEINDIHNRLAKSGLPDALAISYGTSQDVLITLMADHSLSNSNEKARMETTQHVVAIFPEAKLIQANYIGPQVGSEMTYKGLVAIIIALLGTMLYIAFRFDRRFAAGSTLALIHDPILILGIFSFFKVEFNLISLAAVLTVIGYSLNDTIVIFDRVRENFRKMRKASSVEIVNQAINQTLSRTIMTSVLTLTVVLALFFLGGHLLYGFSLALIIGIVVGTYSSIYVAGSLTLALGLSRQHIINTPREIDTRP